MTVSVLFFVNCTVPCFTVSVTVLSRTVPYWDRVPFIVEDREPHHTKILTVTRIKITNGHNFGTVRFALVLKFWFGTI